MMTTSLEKSGITLLGLGPGGVEYLTGEAKEWLSGCSEIYARTASHPALQDHFEKLTVHGFDDLYEYGASLQEIHEQIVSVILELGKKPGGVTYAVPGHPLFGDVTCKAIIQSCRESGTPVRVIQGISYLGLICSGLELDICQNLTILDSLVLKDFRFPPFSPALPVLIAQLGNRESVQKIQKILLAVYPEDHPVTLVHIAENNSPDIEKLSLAEAGRSERIGMLSGLYLPAISPDASFESLQDVIAHLRAPDGCPWDREQTHQSLRSSLLEETYEALTALDAADPEAMQEEFGDLVMQVVMHAQIASELGEFSMVDIVQGINRKLVRRHPHVFGDVDVEDTENVLKNWEKLKEKERGDNGKKLRKGMLDGVPKDYPALAQAQEYQKRARRVGFDWSDIQGVLDKVREELVEFQEAAAGQEKAGELGDLLFSLVNLARWCDVDAESVLRETNQKFKRRFRHVEERAKETGQNLSEMTLKEMDAFWDEAKGLE